MPTKIETILDAVKSLVSDELTGYRELPNSYSIDENNFLNLEKGFGVAVGPAVNTKRTVGCLLTWERSFFVTVVRRVSTTQNNIELREAFEKELLVDHDLLIKAVENNLTLGGNAMKSTISNDGGINFIDGERMKFLAMEITLLVEYQENPTA